MTNEPFAKHFIARRNPIGKHLTINSASVEIVGIANDARINSLRGAIEPKFYCRADHNLGAFSFEIRTGRPGILIGVRQFERLQNGSRRQDLASVVWLGFRKMTSPTKRLENRVITQ